MKFITLTDCFDTIHTVNIECIVNLIQQKEKTLVVLSVSHDFTTPSTVDYIIDLITNAKELHNG